MFVKGHDGEIGYWGVRQDKRIKTAANSKTSFEAYQLGAPGDSGSPSIYILRVSFYKCGLAIHI